MSELIEKQAVIDALLAKMDTIDDKPDVVLGLAVAAGMIKALPSALDQEPCDDCISRQAAIDAVEDDNRNGLYSCFASNNDAQCFKQIIRDIPSVTPAEKVGRSENPNKWIPVSERLPKEDNEVLITIKSCGKWYVCHSVYRDGLFWQKDFEFNSYRNPIAWMYLPEPYKVESEVNE